MTTVSAPTHAKTGLLFHYVDMGWHVFPVWWPDAQAPNGCACGNTQCSSPGKHPIPKHGHKEATTDRKRIQFWHEQFPNANWAVACGPSGLLVGDIDSQEGFEAWIAIRDSAGFEPFETPTAITGGGGQHLYFANPYKFRNARLARGLEVRGAGGYVLLPPSRHHSGGSYEWVLRPDEFELAKLPAFLESELKQKRPTDPAPKIEPEILEGGRNNTMTSLAGTMRRWGMGEAEILAELKVANQERCKPPLDEAEVAAIAHSIARYAPAEGAVLERPPTSIEQTTPLGLSKNGREPREFRYHRTDEGNAERIVQANEGDIGYVYDWNSFAVWDMRRWMRDATQEMNRRALRTIDAMHDEARQMTDTKEKLKLGLWAYKSESRFRVAAMIEMAKPLVPMLSKEFDREPMLVTVRNGVIDLANSKLYSHRRNLKLTKLINHDYNPKANAPHFLAFLDLIMRGESELVMYLQAVIGYCLTGRIDERCLFFLLGPGLNGKTTLAELLLWLFGDFAVRLDIDSLMLHRQRSAGPTPHIANLEGVRLAIASEVPEGRRLNESLVKELTGGDSITARRLYSSPTTFDPTHKLWIHGNHKPQIQGTDRAIWDRLRIIPFAVTIPNDVRKPMHEVLDELKSEAEGILAWIVEGARRWTEEGLKTPKIVQDATREYREDSDTLQQFIDDELEFHPDYRAAKSDIFKAMLTWAEAHGENALLRRRQLWMTRQLKERGCTDEGISRGMIGGVRIRKPV